jgi:hypothetical protein
MPVTYPNTLEAHSLERPTLSQPLWRYLDFTKFLAILVNHGLYMSRLDRLDDKYEGWIPDTPRAKYRGFFQEEDFVRDQRLGKRAARLRKAFYVNCWHANDEESDAMWKIYARGDYGVAIRTTRRHLSAALKDAAENVSLYRVDYTDQARRPTHGGSVLRACLTKRRAFKHEKEVRLIWQRDTSDGPGGSRERSTDGFYVHCDLGQLLEGVRVAPTSKPWFTPVVRDILQKYEINPEVWPSALTRAASK